MKKKSEEDSSSSEDEALTEALKEAADQHFLKATLFHNDDKNVKTSGNNTNVVTSVHNSENCVADQPEYQHGLSDSCKEFIAQKLHKRLNKNIIIEDDTPKSKIRNSLDESTGIKLFTSSSCTLEKIDEPVEIKQTKRKSDTTYDEKANLRKCKEVVVEPTKILLKHDVKFWTNRKEGKQYKYKKHKSGKLLEIN